MSREPEQASGAALLPPGQASQVIRILEEYLGELERGARPKITERGLPYRAVFELADLGL